MSIKNFLFPFRNPYFDPNRSIKKKQTKKTNKLICPASEPVKSRMLKPDRR